MFDASPFGVNLLELCIFWELWCLFCWFDVFCFSGGFVFICFFMFFGGFFDFSTIFFARFYLVLLTKMGTIFKILLQFFFFGVYWLALMGDTSECLSTKFEALYLVFNRICKSIKKYKTVMLGVFQGVNVYRLHEGFS